MKKFIMMHGPAAHTYTHRIATSTGSTFIANFAAGGALHTGC